MSSLSSIDGACVWLQNLGWATRIRESAWLFPTIESLHVLALVLVVGSIMRVDCRLLGLGNKDRPFTQIAAEMLPWSWCAFAVAAVAGALMFSSKAVIYADNFAFRLKVCCLLLAGANMAYFHRVGMREVAAWDHGVTPGGAKFAGGLSLLLWVVIVGAGRWVGFTT
jgi:hypothetical protein